MDRNSVLGLSLIALIFLVYIFYFAPDSPPPAQSTANDIIAADTIRNENANDSTVARSGGADSTRTILAVNSFGNEDLGVDFSNHGVISAVTLKKFKTYYQKDLNLASSRNNRFSLMASIDNKPVDLYQLFYDFSQSSKGDSTVVQYTTTVGSATITHTYFIPKSGYQIRYTLDTKGVSFNTALTYTWNDNIPLQEKQIEDSRIRTTTNWFSTTDGFDNISENSLDLETEAVTTPIRWASFRQKFFLSAIIADKPFATGDFTTFANKADTSHVKDATMKLTIPADQVINRTAGFKYYFGPNDYKGLGNVTESFERNVYIGWPPVKWVNQLVIMPIFHLLEKVISNYGLIIMILVIIIRLLLTPLSYSSYLGMAKMRLLKPELDLIKEKNGDNLAQAQQDQMKLYKEAGVNPFSGCIPLILQLPILLSMFYFFPASIEFRQQHFLWAEDLSTYDSILNLPFTIPGYGDHVSLFVLLMTISTLVSTWQNNQLSAPQGPMKTVSYIMPVVFLFILNSFSAALSFYYFVSNMFGFAQQLVIRRFVDEAKIKMVMDDHKKKLASGGGPAGPGKKSKFMARIEEAMRAQEDAKKKNPKK
jgi:YidC/Oxa1 family membrane protein insertase